LVGSYSALKLFLCEYISSLYKYSAVDCIR